VNFSRTSCQVACIAAETRRAHFCVLFSAAEPSKRKRVVILIYYSLGGGGGGEWVSVLTLKGHSVLLTFHSVSSALHYLQLSLSIKSIYLVSRQCQSPCLPRRLHRRAPSARRRTISSSCAPDPKVEKREHQHNGRFRSTWQHKNLVPLLRPNFISRGNTLKHYFFPPCFFDWH
jgi:hypothetical protein